MGRKKKDGLTDFLQNEWIECPCGHSERADTTPSYCTVCGRDFDGTETIFRGLYPRGWEQPDEDE